MKNIKAIIFDAYGTLFDVNSAAEKCKDKIGEKWERFANFWRTTQLEYTWLRSLMDRHKDFWQVTEDSLDKSMKVFDIDPSMRNELLNLYKVLSPFEEVPETLKTLKEKKFKLAILSNGTMEMLNNAATKSNINNQQTDNQPTEQQAYYNPQNFGGLQPAVFNQGMSFNQASPFNSPNPFNQYNPYAGPNQGRFIT